MALLTAIEVGLTVSMKSGPQKIGSSRNYLVQSIMKVVQAVQDPKGRGQFTLYGA